MAKMLVGKCQCGAKIRLDIGERTREEAIELVKKWTTFDCPGHHVELDSPYPYYWKLDEWVLEESDVQTEEEFEAELRLRYKDVRDTEGMAGLIEGFACGFPMTNDGKCWDFTQSPEGKRWYYTND